MWLKKIESQAEDWFYHELHKRTLADIKAQVKAPAGKKNYRLDFVISHKNLSVGFEIDGKKYHNPERDSKRDREILNNHEWLDSIVRFEAHDLIYNSYFVTLFICDHYPELIVGTERKKGIRPFSRTVSEIRRIVNEGKDHLKSTAPRIKERVTRSLDVQGIYGITNRGVRKKYGYQVHHFEIDFMSGDQEKRFFEQEEKNLHNPEFIITEDGYEDFQPKPVDPLDFTSSKSTTVLIMNREKNE